MSEYYFQYHNQEKMGYLPDSNLNDVNEIRFNQSFIGLHRVLTKKKLVYQSKGKKCFIIVGAGKSPKDFYLWSLFRIEEIQQDDDGYVGFGNGFIFRAPYY